MFEDNDLEVIYCEGYTRSLFPIQHAWLEIDGEVVDLTREDPEEIICFNRHAGEFAWAVYAQYGPGYSLNSAEAWHELYREAWPEMFAAEEKLKAVARENNWNVLGGLKNS